MKSKIKLVVNDKPVELELEDVSVDEMIELIDNLTMEPLHITQEENDNTTTDDLIKILEEAAKKTKEPLTTPPYPKTTWPYENPMWVGEKPFPNVVMSGGVA